MSDKFSSLTGPKTGGRSLRLCVISSVLGVTPRFIGSFHGRSRTNFSYSAFA